MGRCLDSYAILRKPKKLLLVWKTINTMSLPSSGSSMVSSVGNCRESQTTLSVLWKRQISLATIPPHSKQFSLPFNEDVTFHYQPLAAPEGYISRNFSRGIHRERCWPGCPWGVYWNLVRQHPHGDVGPHSGVASSMRHMGYAL